MVSVPVFVCAILVAACGSGTLPVGGDEPLPDREGVSSGTPPIPGLVFDVPLPDLLAEPGPEAGSVRLRFTAPGTEDDGPADEYRVWVSTRQFGEEDLDSAQPVAVSHAPGAPGTSEVVLVRGLEPGRTVQLGVRARRGTELTPLGFAVGGRVAGRDVPTAPASAVRLSGPATLTGKGTTYLLTQDLTTSGTAFEVTGGDVTLDLGGHTVIYGTGGGTAHGVHAQYPDQPGRLVVRNGTLRQGGGGSSSHAVSVRGLLDVRLSYLDATASGPDSHGVRVIETNGTVRIDHCTIHCGTQVVTDRHYPGVKAIYVAEASGTVEIDQNLITASPQWGVHIFGPRNAGRTLVHHNRIVGTKALVANGYMIGIGRPEADVFENYLAGESRGIHVDEIDTDGRNAWIHDNVVRAQDQPNPEYPNGHWVHGIKVEAANGCRVERNYIRTVADPEHGEAYALAIQLGEARGIIVRQNVVESISTTTDLPAYAVQWTQGAKGSQPYDFYARHNVFRSTNALVQRDWAGERGGLFWSNWWLRDLSLGAAYPFVFEYFGNGDTYESRGHRFLDPISNESVLAVTQWAKPAAYDSTREWTCTVVVRRGGTPVSGADVVVQDRTGQTAFQAATDAEGRASGIVTGTFVSRGPLFTALGPHRITVWIGGATVWSDTREIAGPLTLVVDAETKQAVADTAAPTAPEEVHAWPVSASRAILLWDGATDDVLVKRYLVEIDGKPWGVSDSAGIFLGGLEAATPYQATVRAMDAAGNVSPPSRSAPFTTRPEDRGP